MSLWTEEQGQDIAEYAVTLAVVVMILIMFIRMIGHHANHIFSRVISSLG